MKKLGDDENVKKWGAWLLEMASSADESNVPLVKCRDCRDRGYVSGPTMLRLGQLYETQMPCPSCEVGLSIQRGRDNAEMEAQLEAEERRRKGQVRNAELRQVLGDYKAGRYTARDEEPPI